MWVKNIWSIMCKYSFAIIVAVTALIYLMSGRREGILFWGGVAGLMSLGRKNSFLNSSSLFESKRNAFFILAACLAVILAAVLPMSLSPVQNGELGIYNEYELLADSMLNGHVYLDYDDVDPKLMEINPYDPVERKSANVSYHWDNAFYKGRYYMYFGVVPVILLFIPFKLVTGTSLLAFQATQIFVAAFIIGLFSLLHMLSMKYFREIKLGMFVFLSSALSVISVFDCIQTPAMYCTAISAGICMMIWSAYFFVKAVLVEQNEKKQVVYATLGSIFGALSFGCRPTTALGNLFFVALLVIYCVNNKAQSKIKLLMKVVIVIAPYFIVAAGLMFYNYIRFENPFEFGQSYQLTVADQTQYGSLIENFDLIGVVNAILWNYIYYTPLSDKFPYIEQGGFLVCYPIFWLISIVFIIVFANNYINKKAEKRMIIWAMLLTVIITVMISLWTPYMSKRYRLDIYYILSIIGFIVICVWYNSLKENGKKRLCCAVCYMSVLSLLMAFFLFCVPFDQDFTEINTGALEKIEEVIMLR